MDLFSFMLSAPAVGALWRLVPALAANLCQGFHPVGVEREGRQEVGVVHVGAAELVVGVAKQDVVQTGGLEACHGNLLLAGTVLGL